MNKIKMVVAAALLAWAGSVMAQSVSGPIVGATVDRQDGRVIVFDSGKPWPQCKGGRAFKALDAEVKVGCWVAIAEEAVIFIMWKDGGLSNIPAADLRACTDRETCIKGLQL